MRTIIFLTFFMWNLSMGSKPDSINLDKPITNNVLKGLLDKHNSNPTYLIKTEIIEQIMKSNLMLAMLADSVKTGIDSMGNTVILPGSTLIFLNANDNQGNTYIAAFTDWDEIKLFTNKRISTFILKNDDIDYFSEKGIIINPISHKFILLKRR